MKIRKITQKFFWIVLLCSSLFAGDISDTLNQKVSLNFVNTSIEEIMRAFSRQYKLNIVIGETVGGRATIHLEDVTLGNALNVILKSRGYHYIVENDVILIKSFKQITNDELSTRIFPLEYRDGYSLTNTLRPLLSSKGKIEPLISEKSENEKDQRSDILVITDLRENLQKITPVIEKLDIPSKQVQIEVRLIETAVEDEKKVGLNLPKSITVSMTGAEKSLNETGTDGSTDQSTNQSTDPLAAWYQLPKVGDNLNLGILTIDELQATLDFLVSSDNSRLVSNPKVTTLDNHKALIRIGKTVPIQEVSRGVGGDIITFRDKQIDIFLEVIPKITSDGKIVLKVHPVMEEIIGFTGPVDFPQPITATREVKTSVIVNNGETLVLGGLIKETESELVEKVWLLGDIPILKYLFRHKFTKKEKSDLLIFITPILLE